MSRIYLIITLYFFTFLACTNSANSNDQEEADTTDKSVNLENVAGRYENLSEVKADYSSCGRVYHLEIIELANNSYRCFLRYGVGGYFGAPDYACDMTLDLQKIKDGKWLSNEDGWYIVIPQDGFSEDLSSIVLAYEDSSGQVEAYPFDKVK